MVTVALGSLLELTLVSPPLAMLDPACRARVDVEAILGEVDDPV